MRPRPILLHLILTFVLAGCCPKKSGAGPQTVEGSAPSVEDSDPRAELARDSDLVVVGRVMASTSDWEGGHIVTTSRVQLMQLLKGDGFAEGGEVSIAFLGGTVGYTTEQVPHFPTPDVGEISLFFLTEAPAPVGEPSYRINSSRGRTLLVGPEERPSRLEFNRRILEELRRVQIAVESETE